MPYGYRMNSNSPAGFGPFGGQGGGPSGNQFGNQFGGGLGRPAGRRGISPRLIVALLIAAFSIIGYFSNSSINPVTQRKQHIAITADQEIALGLQSAPEMAKQFGGLSRDPRSTTMVKEMGRQLLAVVPKEHNPYDFEFHLLGDPKTVNAFALPGGQVFVTEALYSRLETVGQLAGVLGHEIGHVLARHSAEQMAKTRLAQGLSTSGAIAASEQFGMTGAAAAQFVGQFVLLSYSREHELEADRLGVRIMAAAGYNPESLIGVMRILEAASGGRSGGSDFMATHPNPGRRMEFIAQEIANQFPGGVPADLKE
jgi:beta-barrel assembly-enhancing protease